MPTLAVTNAVAANSASTSNWKRRGAGASGHLCGIQLRAQDERGGHRWVLPVRNVRDGHPLLFQAYGADVVDDAHHLRQRVVAAGPQSLPDRILPGPHRGGRVCRQDHHWARAIHVGENAPQPHWRAHRLEVTRADVTDASRGPGAVWTRVVLQ